MTSFSFVDRYVFVLGYHGHDVLNCLAMYGCDKDYAISWQKDQVGTGNALLSARTVIGNRPFWVSWGDHVVDGQFEDVDRNTVWLTETEWPERFGVPVLSGDEVLRIDEKPKHPASNLVSGGVYFIEDVDEFWPELEKDENFEATLDRLARLGLLWWRRLTKWVDLGTEEAYRRYSV